MVLKTGCLVVHKADSDGYSPDDLLLVVKPAKDKRLFHVVRISDLLILEAHSNDLVEVDDEWLDNTVLEN